MWLVADVQRGTAGDLTVKARPSYHLLSLRSLSTVSKIAGRSVVDRFEIGGARFGA